MTTPSSILGSVQKVIASTPNANFDEASYRETVLEPARRIRRLAVELGDGRPDDAQIREVMGLLVGILGSKRVELDEQIDCIRGILDAHDLHGLFPDLLESLSRGG